jgi:hypothetical protein
LATILDLSDIFYILLADKEKRVWSMKWNKINFGIIYEPVYKKTHKLDCSDHFGYQKTVMCVKMLKCVQNYQTLYNQQAASSSYIIIVWRLWWAI